MPDFIINGTLRKVIKENTGNKFTETPIIIAKYETKGKIKQSRQMPDRNQHGGAGGMPDRPS